MRKPLLDSFFKPDSVAVIGASEKAGSIGSILVQNLIQAGFPGAIYPINPKYPEIHGLPAFPVVTAVPDPVELAIVAVPIKDVPAVIKECGQAGIKGAIIVSAGGRESGPEGKEIEGAIAAAAIEAGVRYLGPNTMGLIVPGAHLNASLSPYAPPPGNLAFISQSGALCRSILGWASQKNIGFSHFVSVGSLTDLDFGDLIDYLGNDEKVRSIILYMESLNQHRKFMSAARSVSRVKPIIVIKAGRSQAGARAAASHTGALVGEDAAYNAAFRRAGIIRVDTVGQLFDCAEALGKLKLPTGGALAIITNAGGPGVMAVDALGRWQIEPGVLEAETMAQLDEALPPHWSRGNPVDIQGDATPERYLQAVRLAMKAPEISGLVIILSPQALTDPTGVARALAPEVQGQARPVFAVWMGGEEVAAGVKILNDAGIPTFETPEQAVDSFMEMYFYSRHLRLLQETPPQESQALKVNYRMARTFIDQCLERQATILTELESKAILAAYGIPVNHTVAASSAPDAAAVARDLGFPVVMKINSPDITHKAEAGGVRLHLHSESEVLAAFHEMIEDVRARRPEARILGVTVQEQEKNPDCELLIGSKQDPDFGPLILFGAGGSFAEVLQDVMVDLPPLNLLLARRLIEKTKVSKVLQGYRDIPPASLVLLSVILVRVSQLVTYFPEIVELDINPLSVISGRFVGLDARIVVQPSTVKAPRHLIIAPYPNQYESDWMMRDGTPVLLRPIKPEDEPLVSNFLGRCSEETIYFRYFRLIKKWTHEMLIRFTQNDYDREMGLMAIGQPPGPEIMLGVSRLVMEANRETAEFAVIIADPWQGKGLGPKLLEEVIAIARERGVKLLWGEVLATNQPMLDMVKRLGFSLTRQIESQTFRVEMELQK
ncbi:MAG: bifunctional acetate--CoA ligase family protein/GNAT family N-acetyltransferase [Deltaproteobacteria bacterium]|nr:bifunctional acetate--CoA ligase family protein/GNAT family N-acetyltransferase [Deltaproteobacteria bacterium]